MSFFVVAHVLFGLIVGSFINVLILRYGSGRTMLGRSNCASCAARLEWFELIPVLSWVVLRGRCRSCGSRISAQYPAVETSLGILYGFVAAAFLPLLLHVLGLVIASLLLAIAVYDLKHSIIPDAWAYSFAVFALLFSVLSSPPDAGVLSIFAYIAAGAVLASPLAALWFLSRGRWMGLGDAKLVLGIGLLLGLSDGLAAVLLAFIAGAVTSLLLVGLSSLTWKRVVRLFTPTRMSRTPSLNVTMKSEMPFGPFLIATCFVVWFMGLYGVEADLLYLMYGV